MAGGDDKVSKTESIIVSSILVILLIYIILGL
jgi:hypothetical protein